MHLVTKILEGLRRASEKLVREEAARTPGVTEDAKGRADREHIKAVLNKLVYLMNSLQVKSGSELAFPMLFDHMSFSTHRTWEMNMNVPYAKALSSWERHFGGSLKALRQDANFATQLGFILPSRLLGPTSICRKVGSWCRRKRCRPSIRNPWQTLCKQRPAKPTSTCTPVQKDLDAVC